jgi:hypothetical protein
MKKEMAVSFFLACVVVVGALWLISESDQRAHKQNQNVPDVSTKPYPSRPPYQADRASTSDPKSNRNAQEDLLGRGRVIKCTVNGKTIYSDEKCQDGAKTHQVELHDTAGVVSPPKAVLAELTAQRHAAERVFDQQMQKQVSATVQSPKMECDALDKRIEWLNAMARQPQSGQTQDWIKQEKMIAQSRQYEIHC